MITTILPAIPNTGTRSAAFSARLRQVLGALGVMNPAIYVNVDLWRLAVITNTNDYPDNQPETFIRLAEGVPGVNIEHEDKFYQAQEGLIRTRINWLIIPAGYGIESDDHVFINNVPYMITEAKEMMGVCRCTISQPKNRWIAPLRGSPTFRLMSMQAYIV